MLSEGAMLQKYYMYLKQEYRGDNIRQYFAADCIGLQQRKNVKADYWCLSKEVKSRCKIAFHLYPAIKFLW